MEAEERPPKIRKLAHESPDGTDDGGDSDSGGSSPDITVITEHNAQEPATQKENGPTVEADEKLVQDHDDGHSDRKSKNGVVISEAPAGLSKNAQKRLRKQLEWEAKKPERKAKRKEERRRKKERDLAARAAGEKPDSQERWKKLQQQQRVPLTVIFDCNFDELMTDKEIISLASQFTRCYSENKVAQFKVHLALSSFGGRLKNRFDTTLGKAYKSWKGFQTFDDDFVHVAEQARSWMGNQNLKELRGALLNVANSDAAIYGCQGQGEVIYLSSDSDFTLEELKPYDTYIIGGLVDRNRHKGICYKHAMDKSVKTAKLPIGQYIQMSSRQVLTTNQVLEIMLKWLEVGDWGRAFIEIIPKRKGGTLLIEGAEAAVGQEETTVEELSVGVKGEVEDTPDEVEDLHDEDLHDEVHKDDEKVSSLA